METLPKTNPTEFCKAFIVRELRDYQDGSPIWMSYWPVMKRMIERADELDLAFNEIIEKFGYSDKQSNPKLWLTLEHMWFSADFCKKEVVEARHNYKEFNALHETITELSFKLASALRRQDELFESSGFRREGCQFVDDMIHQASEGNYLYEHHLGPQLESLGYQYDLKYWPDRADVVEAIGNFEEQQEAPKHMELPQAVILGRATDIKDFVLAFDDRFDDRRKGLTKGFRFSNNAMADIINIILDLSADKMATPDSNRVVRNRHTRSKTLIVS